MAYCIQLSCLYSLLEPESKLLVFQLFSSEGNQSFATLRLPFGMLILNLLLKNRNSEGASGPPPFLSKRFR